jgi:outer membrane protein assembly factor BamA
LCAILWIVTLIATIQLSAWNTNEDKQRSHSVFSIIMYDSDIGFRFGGRGVVKNTFYKNESFDLMLFVSTLGRAFTEQLIGEMGLFYNFTTAYGYQNINTLMSPEISGEGENLSSYFSGRIRWNTHDSQIHPKEGLKLGMNFDLARKSLGEDYASLRYRIEANCYQTLFHTDYILAARLWAQHIDGTPPYYEQSIIGGGRTARGYKKDRFIDHAILLASLEYRFIIYRRIGGFLFIDT